MKLNFQKILKTILYFILFISFHLFYVLQTFLNIIILSLIFLFTFNIISKIFKCIFSNFLFIKKIFSE